MDLEIRVEDGVAAIQMGPKTSLTEGASFLFLLFFFGAGDEPCLDSLLFRLFFTSFLLNIGFSLLTRHCIKKIIKCIEYL